MSAAPRPLSEAAGPSDAAAATAPPLTSCSHIDAALHHLAAAQDGLAPGSAAAAALDDARRLLFSVRRAPIPGPGDVAHLDTSLLAVPETVGVIRDLCRRAAASLGADPRELGDVAVAVTEAATNAVRHGYPPGLPGPIDVQIRTPDPGVLHIVISDHGGGLSAASRSPGLGKGLLLIQELAASCAVTSGAKGGTSVQLWFSFAAAQGPLPS